MGNNFAFTVFEQTVIGAYDLGVLDKNLLGVLMESYRGTDIDSGGREGVQSHDGLEVEQVVAKIWGLDLPQKPAFAENKPVDTWTDAESDQWDEYMDDFYDHFRKVTNHFGWC